MVLEGPWTKEKRFVFKQLDSGAWTKEERSDPGTNLGLKRNETIWEGLWAEEERSGT